MAELTSVNGDRTIIETPADRHEDEEIIITLKARAKPEGYYVTVESNHMLYPDTIVDICSRAARVYERVALLQQMAEHQRQAMQQASEARRLMGGIKLG
jgi:hypothetical protein